MKLTAPQRRELRKIAEAGKGGHPEGRGANGRVRAVEAIILAAALASLLVLSVIADALIQGP